MRNQRLYPGNVMPVVATAAIAAGELVLAGDLVGVAVTAGAIGDTVSVELAGVYDVPKATGTGTGVVQGQSLYFDATAKVLTPVATGNKFAGFAWEAAGTAAAIVAVKLQF